MKLAVAIGTYVLHRQTTGQKFHDLGRGIRGLCH